MFFNMLTSEGNSFITINDFCKNVDQIIKLSQPVKEGLFAYMDKLKIGLVDLKNFLKFMNKSAVVKEPTVTDDNFD